MLTLKHNTLSSGDLIEIERQYLCWWNKSNSIASATPIVNKVNVLDHNTTTSLFGYLLGMFSRLEVLDTLDITPSQFLDFLIDVESRYESTFYHSFYHATDVVLVLYYILLELKAKKYLKNNEIAILMVAAICHDAGHTGYNNDYHVKFNTELSIRYKCKSVLESLSVDISLELLKKHSILQDEASLALFEKLILSTDMINHYGILEDAQSLEKTFQSVVLYEQDNVNDSDIESLAVSETPTKSASLLAGFESMTTSYDDGLFLLEEKERISFATILLHAADISNTVRCWHISKQWSDLIVQEFFRQGDTEKNFGRTVSPGMDRDLATQASISLKFGDHVVKPYFEALANLLPNAKIFLENLEDNRVEWSQLNESPFATSITSYFNEFLLQKFSKPDRKVSVPAGTINLPSPTSSVALDFPSKARPMPITRTSSRPNLTLMSSPPSSTSTELRRNSTDYHYKLSAAKTDKYILS